MYSFFTYSLKNLSQSQKSLEEYFSTPFKCIYSIYIHSWAHEWRPFRKAFLLIVWKECLTSIIHFPHMASRSAAAYWTLVSANQTLPKNIDSSSNSDISFFKQFQYWMLSIDPQLYGTGDHVWTLCSRHFASLPSHIWFNSTEMQIDTH